MPIRLWQIGVAVLLIAIALFFPRFGGTYEAMRVWNDQALYMRILDMADTGQIMDALSINYMGPSYIALVQALKSAFALDSIGALVLLNRSFVALAVVTPVVAYGLVGPVDSRRLAAALGVYAVFLLSTPFMFSSSIPWSHYVFGLSGVLFVLSLSIPSRRISALCAGITWGIIATTRMFEAEALAGLIIAYLTIYACRKRALIKEYALVLGFAAIGVFIGYFAHVLVLGRFHFYQQYSDLLTNESYLGSSLNVRDLPVKFIQFFFDPCFYSLCDYVDFQKYSTFVFESDQDFQNWRMPFTLQLPFYVATFIGGILILLRRPKHIGIVFTDPVMFVSLGAAVGLPLAYFSYIVGGSDQLKYGFVREMYFPSLCLMIVIIHLLTGPYLRTGEKTLLFCSIAAMALIGLQVAPSFYGYPRLTNTHIARVAAAERCADGSCSLSLSYFNPSGQQITIPFDRLAMVRFRCAGETTFAGVVDIEGFRYRRSDCPNGFEVIALSTTTGVSRLTRDEGVGGRIQQ